MTKTNDPSGKADESQSSNPVGRADGGIHAKNAAQRNAQRAIDSRTYNTRQHPGAPQPAHANPADPSRANSFAAYKTAGGGPNKTTPEEKSSAK